MVDEKSSKLPAIMKIIGGFVILIIGLWLILPLKLGPFSGAGWEELLTVLKGTVPAFLVLIGILLVWIEAEEMKS